MAFSIFKRSSSEPIDSDSVRQGSSTNKYTEVANPDRNSTQSQAATILIGLLIIASGLLLYNYFQATMAPETTTITQQEEQEKSQKPTPTPTVKPSVTASTEGSYTVKPGDSLWSIAEQIYGDGHRWPELAESNNIAMGANGNPEIEVGQTLKAPNSAARSERQAGEVPSKSQDDTQVDTENSQHNPEISSPSSPSFSHYTVKTGDTLWSIAEQAYGDGYRWVDIYQEPSNNLGQLPNGTPLIHAGNQLYLP